MSFYREAQHTARKPYRCDACGQGIEAGERYTRWAGMCEGEFVTGAFHPDCREWEIKLCRDAGLDADDWRSLQDHVGEDGLAVLDGAPEAVRARFVPAPSAARRGRQAGTGGHGAVSPYKGAGGGR